MGEKSKWQNKLSELDSFWDLDSLISKPFSEKKAEKRSPEQCTADITSDDEENNGTVIKKYIIPQRPYFDKDHKPEKEFSCDNSLIHSTKIYSWKSNYNYYENFYNDVKRFRSVHCDDAEEVKFFSYVPQYSQMNTKQSRWYFYWRDRARQGEFLPTDYSYIILYIFEIINSEYDSGAEKALEQMCLVWKNYRKAYPQLDKYLCEWICDFGLINNVSVPRGIFGNDTSEIMRYASVKEYYASSYIDDSDGFVDIILEFCSNYDYKKSRYYSENSHIYDTAVKGTLKKLIDSGALTGFNAEDCSMRRDSYVGALCSFHAKKKIEITYCSFSRTNEFRFIVGDVIKYIENKIRTYLSIKSKLGVFSLNDDIKKEIDGIVHFDPLKKKSFEKQGNVRNDYDRLYDPPKKEFSLSDAKKIESDSWETTKKLVEAFEEDDQDEIVQEEVSKPSEASSDRTDVFGEYIEFLVAVKRKSFSEQKLIAEKMGKMIDNISDEINEKAIEVYGDVLLEDNGDGYAVIPEYEGSLDELIDNRGVENGKLK